MKNPGQHFREAGGYFDRVGHGARSGCIRDPPIIWGPHSRAGAEPALARRGSGVEVEMNEDAEAPVRVIETLKNVPKRDFGAGWPRRSAMRSAKRKRD